ncbi:PIG-L family deacetylase [Streptomyces sp. NBC_00178]|uniref:PIG-L deacetylase family protein n=1 Tax=Streptomyces sp. NBC_00178 TaxID=2975672 RepID=UPI002E27C94C|nr:PIG-L family deacetylase [Streptomyces sp. NBC_00178]
MSARPDDPSGYADPIQAPGTAEGLWATWPGWGAMREYPLPSSGRVVVVAAHPDDEVLGFGGTLALLSDLGHPLTVVAVTDGEASHPHSAVLRPRELAAIRSEETRTALGRLGAGHADVVRLNIPDSRVAQHEDDLRTALLPLCRGAALVAAPWTGDVHSDHEAAGRAARAAAEEADVPLVEYPVWLWHWAEPGDPRVPWSRAAQLPLSPEVQVRKRHAIDAFASQILPLGPGAQDAAILPPEEIAHHLRPREVVFR